MLYFKVQLFGDNDYVEIDETELEMCIRAQATGKVAVTRGGSITGSAISAIRPDINRIMGFNRGYRLTSEDYALVPRKVLQDHETRILEANTRLQPNSEALPTSTKRPEVISRISSGTKAVADKFKIKS